MKSQPHGQWVHTPPTNPPSDGHPPNLSELDTLILENFKLQAQIVTLSAQLASLQARLDVQELQQKYVNHLNSVQQPENQPHPASYNGAADEKKDAAEWKTFHDQWKHDPVREHEKLPIENQDRVSAHTEAEIRQRLMALNNENGEHQLG